MYKPGTSVNASDTSILAKAALLLSLWFLATPAVLADSGAEQGQMLFRHNCAACHGNDGKGGVGVPLALPEFIDSTDDEYLRLTVLHGRPGRIMPAFSHLNADEINNIIAFMRSWTGQPGKQYSRQRIKGDNRRGAEIFKQRCSACHGAHGEGGHGTGVTFSRPRDLPILAPALNNPGFLSAVSDAMIRDTLTHGRKGTPMISFAKAGLSKEDINNVVAYVRSFEADHPTGESAPDNEPATLVVESPFTIEKTVENLKQAVVSANMRLIRTQYLDEGLVNPGKENKSRMMVYSCGFNFLNEALKIDPRVGVFLPCRVTVLQHENKVLVMTVNPKRLSYLFNNRELTELCGQMKKRYTDLMEEATF